MYLDDSLFVWMKLIKLPSAILNSLRWVTVIQYIHSMYGHACWSTLASVLNVGTNVHCSNQMLYALWVINSWTERSIYASTILSTPKELVWKLSNAESEYESHCVIAQTSCTALV